MLLLFMASSKVIVIICGTSFDGRSPGIVVPSSEQKQSGRTQTAGSHGGARFGSLSISAKNKKKNLTSPKKKLYFTGYLDIPGESSPESPDLKIIEDALKT